MLAKTGANLEQSLDWDRDWNWLELELDWLEAFAR